MENKPYSDRFKVRVLDKVAEWDNVKKVADHFDISRLSVYRWKEDEEEIRKGAELETEQEQALIEQRRDIMERIDRVLPKTIGEADRYLQMLKDHGTMAERKAKLNALVEGALWQVVGILEDKDLSEVHPKDLSRIMSDLERVRRELAGEPTIIIEERNKMKEMVVVAAEQLFGADGARKMAARLEAMAEAEYQEVG